MKVHMGIQAGAKPVDKGDSTQVQVGRVSVGSILASRYQTLLHHAQEDAQRCIERTLVALQVVANAFGHRQHPLAHRQAGKDVVAQVRCGLGHAACVA